MAGMKIVSLVDHEVTRARASVIADLQNLSVQITSELAAINTRLRTLRADVDKLLQQGGETPKASG